MLNVDKLLPWLSLIGALAALLKSYGNAARTFGMMEAAKREAERRIADLEKDVRQQALAGAIVGGALERLNSVDERLGRIEQWIMDGNRPPAGVTR